MATGAMHWLKLHETHMQSQDFVIPAVAPNGQQFSTQMKGMLEPIMLYRYVFPEAALPYVINTLGDNNKDKPNALNAQAWALRKALNLKKIPDSPNTDVKMPVSMEHLQIVPIGIKEDPTRIMNSSGVKQEAI